MFAHIQIGARNIERMVAFYDVVLGTLGISRSSESDEGGFIWSKGDRWPQFVVREPFNELPATWGNGSQTSFLAESRDKVETAWKTALANGGFDEGAPQLRPRYAPDFFASYCRDPEGNKLCFVFTAHQSVPDNEHVSNPTLGDSA